MKKSEAGSTGRRFATLQSITSILRLRRDYSNEDLLFAIKNIGLIFVHVSPSCSSMVHFRRRQ